MVNNDDLDLRIAAAHESPDFHREVEEFEDAKRNADDAGWFDDYVRCDPDYTIDFNSEPDGGPRRAA
jgi:hypothetical protein